jgi:hypothetical protein
MSDELLAVSRGQGTAWAPLQDLILARKVNTALGGALVGPWDIGSLDEATLEIIAAYVDELPGLTSGREEIEAALARWRADHPSYGKHRRNLRH